MTSFHYGYDENAQLQSIITELENKDLKKNLINDRKTLWKFVQQLISEFFEGTTNFFLSLSVKELYDVLSLTNTFLEIGFEFSNPKES